MNEFCKSCVEYEPGSGECSQPKPGIRLVAVLSATREHAVPFGFGRQFSISSNSPDQSGSLLARQNTEIDACIGERRAEQEAVRALQG